MKVVILAGGMGTRISEESQIKPKPMVEIGESPILWHIMKYYSYYGYNDFIICCGYKGFMIKEYFANYYMHSSDITFDFSQQNNMIIHNNVAEPWKITLVDTGLNTQTGARIKKVQKYIGNESFMLTYGDGLSDVPLNELVNIHKKHGKVLTMTAIQPGGRFGVLSFGEDDYTIDKFTEKAREDGGWINGGFMVAEPEVFDYLEYRDDLVFEQVTMHKLASSGQLDAYKHFGFWQCMDTMRDRLILEHLWTSNKAPWKLW